MRTTRPARTSWTSEAYYSTAAPGHFRYNSSRKYIWNSGNYPTWAIKKLQQKVLHNHWEDTSNNNPTNNNSNTSTNNIGSNSINNQDSIPTINTPRNKTTIGQIVIPYTKGISESIKHAFGKYGIQVHFKGNQTIKQILMKPKEKDPKDSKSGVIYSYQCPHLDCNEEYMAETSRTLRERRKEHPNQPSPIHRHAQTTDMP